MRLTPLIATLLLVMGCTTTQSSNSVDDMVEDTDDGFTSYNSAENELEGDGFEEIAQDLEEPAFD